MKKIIVVVQEYPQLSETYIKNEIRELSRHYEIEVVSFFAGNFPYRNRLPHIIVNKNNVNNVLAYLKEFDADYMHGHYIKMAPAMADFSKALDLPFTIRSHSFDVSGDAVGRLDQYRNIVNSEACTAVLGFPYTIKDMVRAGFKESKLHHSFPVVDVDAFIDTSDNGTEIMNVGAALPKKQMEDYIHLSKLLPEKTFNLYALGYNFERLTAINRDIGGRVRFMKAREPEAMPSEYKKHEWLVYTASRRLNTVGWPMAIAEAQAAGVGVCMQRTDNDLDEYVGDAGYFFESPEQAAEIIRNPFPGDKRAKGFELAKRSDVKAQVKQLEKIWQQA